MSTNPDQSFDGYAYVARIRDSKGGSNVSVHKKKDLFHAIVYEDPTESFPYMDLKALIEDKNQQNQLIFYTWGINKKNRSSFTWGQCLDALTKAGHKPNSTSCISYHEKPISFAQFGIMAYEQKILSDSQGYNDLWEKLIPPPPKESDFPDPSSHAAARSASGLTEDEAVRHGIDQAAKLNEYSGEFELNVGATVVIGNTDGEELNPLTMEYWKAKALTAESKVAALGTELEKEKAIIARLREELAACGDAKQRFGAQADLAASRLNEYKTANAEPFIEAIKPHIACLPAINNMMKELLDKFTALGDVPSALKNVHDDLLSLTKLSSEAYESLDENRASENKTIISAIKQLSKVLDHFGVKTTVPSLDIPKVVGDIWQASRGGPAHDVSRPPPSQYHPSPNFMNNGSAPTLPYTPKETFLIDPFGPKPNFLLDPANNHVPQGFLLQQPACPPPNWAPTQQGFFAPAKRSYDDSYQSGSKRR